MANVNGEAILLSDLKERFQLARSVEFGSVDRAPTEKELRETLDAIIIERAIDRRASEMKVEIKPEEIDKEIQIMLDSANIGIERFRETLEAAGLTIELYRDRIRHNLIARRLSSFEIEPPTVGREEALAFYEREPELFNKPARLRISHILIERDLGGSAESLAEKRRKLQRAQAELARGAPFEEVARKYSDDRSGENGGDIGWVKQGELDPAFERGIARLKVGQISDVIETRFGFHIARVTDASVTKHRPFEEVEAEARAYLRAKIFQERREKWVEKVKSESYVKIFL